MDEEQMMIAAVVSKVFSRSSPSDGSSIYCNSLVTPATHIQIISRENYGKNVLFMQNLC